MHNAKFLILCFSAWWEQGFLKRASSYCQPDWSSSTPCIVLLSFLSLSIICGTVVRNIFRRRKLPEHLSLSLSKTRSARSHCVLRRSVGFLLPWPTDNHATIFLSLLRRRIMTRKRLRGMYIWCLQWEGVGGYSKIRCSKGGCVNLVLWFGPKCRQGGEGTKSQKFCWRHMYMAP